MTREAQEMLDTLKTMLSVNVGPSHATLGEAYLLHQSLAAYYYLKVKMLLFARHSQTPELKEWFETAAAAAEERIPRLQATMNSRGIPLPPTMAPSTELTDQFMAVDAAAMITGMLQTDVQGLQAARHPDTAALYRDMLDGTLLFGAKLWPIMLKEGWTVPQPTYPAQTRS